MDQLTTYKTIVREIVQDIASISPSDEAVKTQVIMDEQRGHYLLFSVGWEGGNVREYSPFVHIDVCPDGKIWIQHDGTNLKIALMLVDAGIPSQQIVLGFKAPYRRAEVPGFAQD